MNPHLPDTRTIQAAELYLEVSAPSWTLDPRSHVIGQPENQQDIITNLRAVLTHEAGGRELAQDLDDNLRTLYEISSEEGSEWTFLNIKPLKEVGISLPSSDHLRYAESVAFEPIATPDSPNLMLSGILAATGAVTLRDDFAAGERVKGTRVYAGMLYGKRVYLSENVLPRFVEDQNGTRKIEYWERRVTALSEEAARERLERPSERDMEVLRTLGENKGNTPPTRSSIAQTIGFLAAFVPPDERK